MMLFLALFSFAFADECIQSCSDEFANCVNFKDYDTCRQEIDDGVGILANQAGCASGCTNTDAMDALNTNTGTTANAGPTTTATPTTTGTASDPEACTEANKGHCECASDTGFSTYVYTSEIEETRCFTIYTPDSEVPTPVVFYMQCYGSDRLNSIQMSSNADLIKGADQYGYSAVA